MTAAQETQTLQQRLERRGIFATFDQVNTLRRAELTLHRWFELECGDGNEYASWSIERNDDTERPYMVRYSNRPPFTVTSTPISDREKGARERIARICNTGGYHYYIQSDPRGCALYVATEPMTDNNYSSVGMAVTA